MKTPREILLSRHQSASPRLDAIRAELVASLPCPSAPEGMSLRKMVMSLRWHLAAMSAAWALALILNLDHSPGATAMLPGDKSPDPRQIWAALRENRRLLLQYTETPAAEPPAAPGRRSEIKTEMVVA
jgi:hypothetical protein